MANLPTNPSETLRKLNPHLYGAAAAVTLLEKVAEAKQRRIRQDHKPLLNKLETEALTYLQQLFPGTKFMPQAKRYRLANGVWYKPDFTAMLNGVEQCWEVKGPHAWRAGMNALKVAAHAWPQIYWTLLWKDNGQWRSQIIIP